MALVETTGGGKENDPPRQPGDGPNTDKTSAEVTDCPVCFTGILRKERALLACGHVFCFRCLSKWATKKETSCPVCRQRFQSAKKISKEGMEEKTRGAKRKMPRGDTTTTTTNAYFRERTQGVPLRPFDNNVSNSYISTAVEYYVAAE